jgi:phosphoenolpyruvate carboxylase
MAAAASIRGKGFRLLQHRLERKDIDGVLTIHPPTQSRSVIFQTGRELRRLFAQGDQRPA